MASSKIIRFEESLGEMFTDLPMMKYEDSNDSYEVVFGCGDGKELNSFLKLAHRDTPPYPLIWLLYPYTELHKKKEMEVSNCSLILAVQTNSSMQNKERLATTFEKVLYPLLENIKYLFHSANIVSVNDEYTIVKHPNYSHSEEGSEHAGTLIWDALKVDFDIKLKDTCYRKVNFN